MEEHITLTRYMLLVSVETFLTLDTYLTDIGWVLRAAK